MLSVASRRCEIIFKAQGIMYYAACQRVNQIKLNTIVFREAKRCWMLVAGFWIR